MPQEILKRLTGHLGKLVLVMCHSLDSLDLQKGRSVANDFLHFLGVWVLRNCGKKPHIQVAVHACTTWLRLRRGGGIRYVKDGQVEDYTF